MALNDTNKNSIAFKKLVGKAHTQQTFAFNEESISSNVSISYTTIFGQQIDPIPVTNGLTTPYMNDGVVERIKFQLEIIPNTQISAGRSQGYRLKLPADYSTFGALNAEFSSNTILYTKLGKLQVVPSLYGTLKPDGSTEYDPILYQTNGSTVITKFDAIDWIMDPYGGVIFVQTPPASYDVSATRPGFLEAFLYIGNYLDGASAPIKELFVTTATTVSVPSSIVNAIYIASGTTGYTLGASPQEGAEITFADGLGTGNTTNIMVLGNGRLINGDSYALINTDFGTFTITYNGVFWNVTAFTP